MPINGPKAVLGASVVFFVGSFVWVSYSKEQEKKEMRVAVTKDKERIQRFMEKQADQSSSKTD